MSTGTLSAKQRSFAHVYSASHNATQAARAAGYSETRAGRTGYELLQRPEVVALVSELDGEKRDATGVDEPWIVDRLVAIVEASMGGRPRTNALGELVLDPRSGEPIIDTDFTNANRALATLSKISGLQVPRMAVEHAGHVVYKLHLDRDLEAEGE